MIILTTAHGYNKKQVKPFLTSLKESGFMGQLVVMANNCEAASYLKSEGAEIIPDPQVEYHINSRRFMAYKEYLRGVDEPTIITDVRDVVFQKNPEEHMPTEGVNVYQEWEGMTIGECPYNSKWMRQIFGVTKWGEYPIICAGVTSGRLMEYCVALWEAITEAPSLVGLDQALHAHLAYSRRIDSRIWPNEDGEVYTVGYIPRETVGVGEDGLVRNKAGMVPCIIHQYDRHENIKAGLRWR